MPDYSQYPNWFWQLPASQQAYYAPQIEAGLRKTDYSQMSPSEARDELAFQAGVKPNELTWEHVPHNSLRRPGGASDYDPAMAEASRKFYTVAGYVAPANALKPHEIAKMWDMVKANLVPMKEYAKARNLTYGSPQGNTGGGMSYGLKPWEESPGVDRGGYISDDTYDFFGVDRPAQREIPKDENERAELIEATRPGSDAWHRRENGEGIWAPDYVWSTDEKSGSSETPATTQDAPTTTQQPAASTSSRMANAYNSWVYGGSKASTTPAASPATPQATAATQPSAQPSTTTTPSTTQTPSTGQQTVDPQRTQQVTWFGPNGITYGALLKPSEHLRFKDGQWVVPEGAQVFQSEPGKPLTFPGYNQNPIGQLAQPTGSTPQTPVAPKITIPKAVTEPRESFATAPETSADSPQILPQQTAPKITIPRTITPQRQAQSTPWAYSASQTAGTPVQQPIVAPQQSPSTVNFGPQLPGQRQIYNWAGPQIKLPAEITNQLPQPIVPTQGAAPTTFSPQAASTAPTAQAPFQPPKNIPIPDLSQLQSSTPSSNNLFATINGLQNRSRTTAPNKSGFYGGFY